MSARPAKRQVPPLVDKSRKKTSVKRWRLLFRKGFRRVRFTHHGLMAAAGGEARPSASFHALRVGPRPMNDFPEKFFKSVAQAFQPVARKGLAGHSLERLCHQPVIANAKSIFR